jgi:trans-AT polyketide synthase, acyltransferase and oxidoreductase domains
MTVNRIEVRSGLRYLGQPTRQSWTGSLDSVAFDETGIQACLLDMAQPCFLVQDGERIGATNSGGLSENGAGQLPVVAFAPPLSPETLGDPAFRTFHGVKFAYAAGAMANGIASEDHVIALGKEGVLAAFGAAGLLPTRLESAIQRIQAALPDGPYAFNLIHSPSEEAMERRAVDLYLRYNVRTVEASAFLDLTHSVVRYRASGLSLDAQGQIQIGNKIIAKISRREVATKFMQPAHPRLLSELVQQGLITEQQASLAEHVPMADDVTVEADSGGHTDNRPLVVLLPSMLSLRDEIQDKYAYHVPVRVGAAGGIGTPASALAAFMMGAGYVVTGSINQSCLEAGASPHTKQLLAQAEFADVMMAPAADMFEMGVKVQLLKRGTFFPMRAQKLYDLYKEFDSMEAIPTGEREKLEKQVFRRSLDDVWNDTAAYFAERDPDQITRANENPKRKMALVFRWYLGLSSRWSNAGEKGREPDYQIWCGPSMGAFNDWVRGSYLEQSENRHVYEVAWHIMNGAAFLYRIQSLKMQAVQIPPQYGIYQPLPLR